MTGRLRIGTSGYQYTHWRGVFYPSGLPKSQWFEFYTRHFDIVEINNTFYGLPGADVFDAWREVAPPGFRYALKFSRYASHRKKLKDPRRLIGRFMHRASHLGARLGPILVQLPPHWRVDVNRLERFLRAIPRGGRWAIEFRDPSWLCERVFSMLAGYKVALCWHDRLPRHPRDLTTTFAYLRFHGGRPGGSYGPDQLGAQARRIRGYLKQGIDVYAFFNNDAQGHAARDACDLRRRVERSGKSPGRREPANPS